MGEGRESPPEAFGSKIIKAERVGERLLATVEWPHFIPLGMDSAVIMMTPERYSLLMDLVRFGRDAKRTPSPEAHANG